MHRHDEYINLTTELKLAYLNIADRYRLMSKVNEHNRLEAMQAGIDQMLAQTKKIRAQIESIRAEVAGKWNIMGDG